MSFGEIEEDAYQDDRGDSLGHLDKSGSGCVQQMLVDEATKVSISLKIMFVVSRGTRDF